MTDRIADLRALLEAERDADLPRGPGNRKAFDAWMRAHAASKRAVHANADALLDCAEALPLMIDQLRSALILLRRDDEFIDAQTEKARKALAALNGDDHAG